MTKVVPGVNTIFINDIAYQPTDGVATAEIKKAVRAMSLDFCRAVLGREFSESEHADPVELSRRLSQTPRKTLTDFMAICQLPETKAFFAGWIEASGGIDMLMRASMVHGNILNVGMSLLAADVGNRPGETIEAAAERRATSSTENWAALYADDRVEFREALPLIRDTTGAITGTPGAPARYFFCDVPAVSLLAVLVQRAKDEKEPK